MVNKTLLYKYEYKNLEENTIPKFTPEDIGHVPQNKKISRIKSQNF